MNIELQKASLEDQKTIQNLGMFYAYDMYRYCNWETPENGLYESLDYSRYWKEPDRYPFLIRVDQQLAGFALINKIGTSSDVDWNMGEFFIVSKYQEKGVGSHVALEIFKQFPGIWEVMQMPDNLGAILFWKKVIDRYTGGNFQKTEKMILEPKPHSMVVLRFDSKQQKPDFRLIYQEEILPKEEAVLIQGISENAKQKKDLTTIQSYAFFIRDFKDQIVAGVKGASYYGCLYIDSLWVAPFLRNQGFGSKLMQEVEKLGRKRNCLFASLTTMDFEALPFYQKLGYKIEYTREGYEKNVKMHVLRKSLS